MAIAAGIWVWGALCFIAPSFLRIDGGWQIPFNLLGAIFIAIGFGGALFELAKIWKNEAFGYWGAGLIFLTPALFLLLGVFLKWFLEPWDEIARVSILLLAAFGSMFFFMGLPHLLWKLPGEDKDTTIEITPQQRAVERSEQRVTNAKGIISLIIALLTLLTAIVKIVPLLVGK